MIYENVLEAVGKTPLIRLNKITASGGEKRIYGKAEFMNPGGSIKDRTALSMIKNAEKCGKLKTGDVIVEPTSGHTGIGLAMAGAVLGYKVILTMPENMSKERIKVLSGYGAEVVLTDKEKGMAGAIERAKEIVIENHGFMPAQFDNPANSEAHFLSTAKEILSDLPSVRAIVAGIGTGGTAMGIADYIKANKKAVKVFGVEPLNSAVLSGQKAGTHAIQGIGAGFIPSILDPDKLDGVVAVSDGDAIETAKRLMKEEGLSVGISSGAAVWAAVRISEYEKGDIAVILPDTGSRYLSTELYE